MTIKAKPHHAVVLEILRQRRAHKILDAPCGQGWLGERLAAQNPTVQLDALGLWEFPRGVPLYRSVQEHDLDEPLPPLDRPYDAIVCGEAIHLITNPGLLLRGFRQALRPGGTVIITTPNTWVAGSRGQFLLRGFHSGFNPMVGRRRGEYITYFPFSFPQLHLLLDHHGFLDITLHEVDEPKPRRALERLLAWPGKLYCRRRSASARSHPEAYYWQQAGSDQSLLGRSLVMFAVAP